MAKDLAKALDYIYVDSGAMYRAVTLFFIENNVDIKDLEMVKMALENINIDFNQTDEGRRTILNGEDVEGRIRTMEVSGLVSPVSAISMVRRAMVMQQQALGTKKGIVMDGRDIGTVVFPKAELKIFLTADHDVRVQRRYDELKAKGHEISIEEVSENLKERDRIDSTRKDSPLKKAEDAITLNNSYLTREDQFKEVMALARRRMEE